jgi:hypothetical protein
METSGIQRWYDLFVSAKRMDGQGSNADLGGHSALPIH